MVEYALYNWYGQLEKRGFKSYKSANCFRVSRSRFDWKIREIA